MDYYDVCIIGGGIAGCTVYESITRAGRSVALIEASHRFGGKLFSLDDTNSNAKAVEFGACTVTPTYFALIHLMYRYGMKLRRRLPFFVYVDGRIKSLRDTFMVSKILRELPSYLYHSMRVRGRASGTGTEDVYKGIGFDEFCREQKLTEISNLLSLPINAFGYGSDATIAPFQALAYIGPLSMIGFIGANVLFGRNLSMRIKGGYSHLVDKMMMVVVRKPSYPQVEAQAAFTETTVVSIQQERGEADVLHVVVRDTKTGCHKTIVCRTLVVACPPNALPRCSLLEPMQRHHSMHGCITNCFGVLHGRCEAVRALPGHVLLHENTMRIKHMTTQNELDAIEAPLFTLVEKQEEKLASDVFVAYFYFPRVWADAGFSHFDWNAISPTTNNPQHRIFLDQLRSALTREMCLLVPKPNSSSSNENAIEVQHAQMRCDFFPRFVLDDETRCGFTHTQQSRNNIFYVGSTCGFELVEPIVRHAHSISQRILKKESSHI